VGSAREYEHEPGPISLDNDPRALDVLATGAGSSIAGNNHLAEHSQRREGERGGGRKGVRVGVGSGLRVGGYGRDGDISRVNQGFQDVQETYKGPSTPPRPLPRNITVQRGKTVVLSCRVLNQGDKSVIDYNWRSGVTVTTEQVRDTTSHLQVTHAQLDDSGKYICRPNHGEEASVRLHVLSGEYHQAAM